MLCQDVNDHLTVLHSALVDLVAKDNLLTVVMHPWTERELTAALRRFYAPSGESARDLLDILLRVASVDAQCVELH